MSVAIKLFGKTILQSNVNFSSSDSSKATTCSSSTSIHLQQQQQQQQQLSDEQQQQKALPNGEFIKQENGGICDNPKTPSVDKEAPALDSPTNGEQSDTSNNSTQEKALKKPDKIIPCPRCHSMDTKFCYFNNYNVNQPRHFCKNCQRYWTAGGAMRSVPVGAGRRKNKHLSVSLSEQLLVAEAANRLQPRVNFGSLFCESMASNSNNADRKLSSLSSGMLERNETRDDGSSNSYSMVSKMIQSGLNDNLQKLQSYYPLQAPGFSTPPLMPVFCPPGFHAPFSQHSTYSPIFPTFPGCWNTPLISSNNASSQTSGKHSRDEKSERGVLIPKTLRIDDPSEAAKSSIWATLGLIKNEKNNSKNVGDLFNDLRSTGHHGQDKNRVSDQVSVLHANPAAISRSHNFHETR